MRRSDYGTKNSLILRGRECFGSAGRGELGPGRMLVFVRETIGDDRWAISARVAGACAPAWEGWRSVMPLRSGRQGDDLAGCGWRGGTSAMRSAPFPGRAR